MLQLPWQRSFAHGLILSVSLLALTSCGSAGDPKPAANTGEGAVTTPEPGAGQPEPASAMLEARSQLAQNQPEAALNALDPLLTASRSWAAAKRADFEMLRGDANLALARQGMQGGGSGTMIRACLEDAGIAFAMAAQLREEDPKPTVRLAEVQRERGDWEAVVDAATRAVDRMGGLASAEGDDAVRALELRAEALLRQVLKERQEGEEEISDRVRRAAQTALVDCGRLQQIAANRASSYTTASFLFRTVGEPDKALEVLQQGVRLASEDSRVHDALLQLYAAAGGYRACAGFYQSLSHERAGTPSAMTAWFHGQAELAYGDELRRNGAVETATRRYVRAEEAFARCMQIQPNFASSCRLKQAIARMSQARMQIDGGKLAKGEELLDEAYAISSALAAQDENGYLLYRDGLSKDYRGAIVEIGRHFMDEKTLNLGEAVRFWRKVTERHPDWGFAWNNLGFACRDHGSNVAASGDPETAMALWKESYAAYEKAVEFNPEDPRIVNDCGLMLVYHLKNDYERARELFAKAIELGTDKLSLMPDKSVDEEEALTLQRRDLEEAVGDAWENMAKLHWEHENDSAKAETCLQKSLQFFPYQARDGVQAIQRSIEAASRKQKDERQGRMAPGAPSWMRSLIAALPSSYVGAQPQSEVAKALDALKQGESEKALDLIEPLLAKDRKNAELNYVAGAGSLLFARQAIQSRRRGADNNLIDAYDRLETAAKLARELSGGSETVGLAIHVAPATLALQARILKGEFAQAVAFAEEHAEHVAKFAKRLDADVYAAFAARRAEALARHAIALASGKDKSAKDALAKASQAMRDAVASIEKLDDVLELDAHAELSSTPSGLDRVLSTWKDLELWRGEPAAAIDALGRAALIVGDAAQAGTLIGAMPTIVMQHSGPTLKLEEPALEWSSKALKRYDGNAELRWWRGYMNFAASFVYRKLAKHDVAARFLDASIADYRQAIADAKKPETKNSSKYRIAESLNALALAQRALKKDKEARASWIEAVKLWPDIQNPRDFLSNRTPRDELFILAMNRGKSDMLAGAEELEELARLIPGDWEALNNAALLQRDYCEGRGARRNPGPFMKTLARSYANYSKALRLNPSDVRLANDTALIDIYYLHKNLQESEDTLELAIRRGTSILENQPPQDAGEKRNLEEAVGDCHMNLGLLLMTHTKRYDEAEEHLNASLNYYPGRSRASRLYLRRLATLRAEAEKKDGEGKDGEGKDG
jgi:tetratricopeptide (TPR) repeat protein